MPGAVALGVLLVGTRLLNLESPTLRTKEECESVCNDDAQCVGFAVHRDQPCAFFSTVDSGQQLPHFRSYLKNEEDIKKLPLTPEKQYKQLRGKKLIGEMSSLHQSIGTFEECARQCAKEECDGFEMDGNDGCVTFSGGITEIGGDPQLRKYFIPETPALSCEPGWERFQDSCYKMAEGRANFTNAKEECASLNSHLVYIKSPEENDFVASLMVKYSLSTIWLGMEYCTTAPLGMCWLDGSPVEYNNFYNSFEPLESYCGIMNDDTRWAPWTVLVFFRLPTCCEKELQ